MQTNPQPAKFLCKQLPCTDNRWRESASFVSMGDNIIVFGYILDGPALNSVILNLKENTILPIDLDGVNFHINQIICGLQGNKLVLLGNRDNHKNTLQIVTLDLAKRNISSKCRLTIPKGCVAKCDRIELQFTIFGCNAEVYEDHLYVFGRPSTNPDLDDSVWRISLGDHEVLELPSSSPKPASRFNHKSTIYKNKLYIYGGYAKAKSMFSTTFFDFWEFDISTRQWREIKISNTGLSGKSPFLIHEHDGKIFFFPHPIESIDIRNQIIYYDTETDNFKGVSTTFGMIAAFKFSPHSLMIRCQSGLIIWELGDGKQSPKKTGGNLFSGQSGLSEARPTPSLGGIFNKSGILDSQSPNKTGGGLFGGFSNSPSRSNLQDNNRMPVVFLIHLDERDEQKQLFWSPKQLFSSSKQLVPSPNLANGAASLDTQHTLHMRHLLSDTTFSDIILKVDTQEFAAHKCILAARSKFFHNMFLSGMQESTTTTIPFTDITPTSFQAMLEFIYCGQVVLTEALALDLLAASNKYALPELKARCEEFLVQNLSLETIVKRVELAEQLDAMVLRDGATTYLVKNAKNVTGKIELDELPKGFLIDLLSKTIFKNE